MKPSNPPSAYFARVLLLFPAYVARISLVFWKSLRHHNCAYMFGQVAFVVVFAIYTGLPQFALLAVRSFWQGMCISLCRSWLGICLGTHQTNTLHYVPMLSQGRQKVLHTCCRKQMPWQTGMHHHWWPSVSPHVFGQTLCWNIVFICMGCHAFMCSKVCFWCRRSQTRCLMIFKSLLCQKTSKLPNPPFHPDL